MKLPHSPRGGRLMTGILAVLCLIPQAFAETEISRGFLNVDPGFVPEGIRSQIARRATFPSEDGTVPVKEKYRMCLRTAVIRHDIV